MTTVTVGGSWVRGGMSGGAGAGGEAGGSGSLVDGSWELVDPTPDVHGLFRQLDAELFWGALAGVEVRWSPRMTTCAGVCSYEGRGGLCSVRLSQPLLSLRPRKDLVETLLHEMIHAYLFVTDGDRDRDGHGPQFQQHMRRINQAKGTSISIYHSFHQEVAHFKTHHWRCEGPCRERRPFFGWVKRASNRAPGPNDLWWAQHQASCGGVFRKVKEPEGFGQKKTKTSSAAAKAFAKASGEPKAKKGRKEPPRPPAQPPIDAFFGKGQRLGGPEGKASEDKATRSTGSDAKAPAASTSSQLKSPSDQTAEEPQAMGAPAKQKSPSELVPCPSCVRSFPIAQINAHLDSCLAFES